MDHPSALFFAVTVILGAIAMLGGTGCRGALRLSSRLMPSVGFGSPGLAVSPLENSGAADLLGLSWD